MDTRAVDTLLAWSPCEDALGALYTGLTVSAETAEGRIRADVCITANLLGGIALGTRTAVALIASIKGTLWVARARTTFAVLGVTDRLSGYRVTAPLLVTTRGGLALSANASV